ncbi:MAG: PQQ-binding-like beta-propeller repeat protein [Planctomycetaceae bacterium]
MIPPWTGKTGAQLWPLFAEWESKTADPAQRRLILEKKAAALLAAGYFRSAERLQKQIGRETTAASTESATPQSPYVAKAWERALTLNQRPIIPHGDAPEDSLACALLVGPDLQAWDRQTGVLRWRQPPVGSPVWAAYGETALLLADPHVLSAHELETGELLWQRPWEIPVESFQKENGSIRIFSDRLVVQTAKQTIAAISTANGMTLWEFRPLRGKMRPNWLCDEEHVILQTINPAEVWILDAATGSPSGRASQECRPGGEFRSAAAGIAGDW